MCAGDNAFIQTFTPAFIHRCVNACLCECVNALMKIKRWILGTVSELGLEGWRVELLIV